MPEVLNFWAVKGTAMPKINQLTTVGKIVV